RRRHVLLRAGACPQYLYGETRHNVRIVPLWITSRTRDPYEAPPADAAEPPKVCPRRLTPSNQVWGRCVSTCTGSMDGWQRLKQPPPTWPTFGLSRDMVNPHFLFLACAATHSPLSASAENSTGTPSSSSKISRYASSSRMSRAAVMSGPRSAWGC